MANILHSILRSARGSSARQVRAGPCRFPIEVNTSSTDFCVWHMSVAVRRHQLRPTSKSRMRSKIRKKIRITSTTQIRTQYPALPRAFCPDHNPDLDPDLDPDLFPPASPVLLLFVQGSNGADVATHVGAPVKRGGPFSTLVLSPLAAIPSYWPSQAKDWVRFPPRSRSLSP